MITPKRCVWYSIWLFIAIPALSYIDNDIEFILQIIPYWINSLALYWLLMNHVNGNALVLVPLEKFNDMLSNINMVLDDKSALAFNKLHDDMVSFLLQRINYQNRVSRDPTGGHRFPPSNQPKMSLSVCWDGSHVWSAAVRAEYKPDCYRFIGKRVQYIPHAHTLQHCVIWIHHVVIVSGTSQITSISKDQRSLMISRSTLIQRWSLQTIYGCAYIPNLVNCVLIPGLLSVKVLVKPCSLLSLPMVTFYNRKHGEISFGR